MPEDLKNIKDKRSNTRNITIILLCIIFQSINNNKHENKNKSHIPHLDSLLLFLSLLIIFGKFYQPDLRSPTVLQLIFTSYPKNSSVQDLS